MIPELCVGSTWELSSQSPVWYDDGKFGMTNAIEGKRVLRRVGQETTNGVTSFKGVTAYANVLGLLPQEMWGCSDDQGHCTAMDLRGRFVEAQGLALPPEPRTRWGFFDGAEGWRTVAGRDTVPAGGLRYENWVKGNRGFNDPERAQRCTPSEWHAPGIGPLRFHFIPQRGPTCSEIETLLQRYTPGEP